jgi:fatty-acyl-CoA synthase
VVADEAAFDVDAVARFCRQRLAGYRVPSAFKIESELPRNPTGNVRKNLLVATVG